MSKRTAHTTNVGVIGCGNISGIYLKNLTGVCQGVRITACADLNMKRAKEKAAEHKGVKAVTVDQLLGDSSVDIVLNLTIPQAHFDVAMAAVRAGKSAYNEKPLTIMREEAEALLDAADKKGVRVGCGPDTFLGAGIQTCVKLIDDGWIGRPVAVTAFMMNHGHESWHPAPEFYYKTGGGPMFDMGPYYLTAIVALMGPVKRIAGMTSMAFADRTITSQPKAGTLIHVEVPTHVAGLMDFSCGAVGTIITSFDVWGASLPCIEVYGTEGSLSVPDPNSFGGPVSVKRARAKEWTQVPFSHPNEENSRGLGVADMAGSLRTGRAHRASGDLAAHVLDIMHAFHDASDRKRHVTIKAQCKRPAPLPLALRAGEVD